MNRGQRLAAIAWTCIVLLATAAIVKSIVSPKVYQGHRVRFEATSGHFLELEQPVKVEAGWDAYFGLIPYGTDQDPTFEGKPSERPLGFHSDVYYKASDEFAPGQLEITEGTAEFRVEALDSETESVSVKVLQTEDSKLTTYIVSVILAFLVWIIGMLIILSI